MPAVPLRRTLPIAVFAAVLAVLLAACSAGSDAPTTAAADHAAATGDAAMPAAVAGYAARHLDDTVEVELTSDLSALDARERALLAHLVRAAEAMDPIFWKQSWGDRAALMARIGDDAPTQRLAELNYGPWDRLAEDQPFVAGVGPRPAGAQFYPEDMSREEFEQAPLPDKTGLYTLLRRGADGKLETVPYHVAYRAELEAAAAHLREAAALADDAGLRHYLELRAQALLDDDFHASDLAWMDMKTNALDLVIGPIETYEDALFGYKAGYEAYVLVKDRAWSEKLARFAAYLPELQRELPVEERYKREQPGADADLNAYDAVYYAGDANVGAKTIAINLPNDEDVQLKKGTRRLQLKNVMRAKFDRILMPIANELIAEDQRPHLSFDAFFQDTMFHEVAHGLGIKHTLDGGSTVRHALKEYASSFEEGKADILGLYMVDRLAAKGEVDPATLMDNYVTFLAGIFRSVRFGATDAHAKANMVRFNFFKERGAFSRDAASGRYRVDFDRMRAATDALVARLLVIQGDGDYAEAKRMTDTLGVVDAELAADLKRLEHAAIPVDIRFRQGLDVLGLDGAAKAP